MLQTNLQRMRQAKGLNQAQLARLLEVDRSTVCGWEAGRRTPTLEQAAHLAAVLGCTVDDLVKPDSA